MFGSFSPAPTPSPSPGRNEVIVMQRKDWGEEIREPEAGGKRSMIVVDHGELRMTGDRVKSAFRKGTDNKAFPWPPRLGQMHRLEASLPSQKGISQGFFSSLLFKRETVAGLCVAAGSSKHIRRQTSFRVGLFIPKLSGHLDFKSRGSKTC